MLWAARRELERGCWLLEVELVSWSGRKEGVTKIVQQQVQKTETDIIPSCSPNTSGAGVQWIRQSTLLDMDYYDNGRQSLAWGASFRIRDQYRIFCKANKPKAADSQGMAICEVFYRYNLKISSVFEVRTEVKNNAPASKIRPFFQNLPLSLISCFFNTPVRMATM